jgi:hypothetical protein
MFLNLAICRSNVSPTYNSNGCTIAKGQITSKDNKAKQPVPKHTMQNFNITFIARRFVVIRVGTYEVAN